MKANGMDEYLGNYDYYVEKQRELLASDEPVSTVSKTQIKKEKKKENLKRNEIKELKAKLRNIEKEMEEADKEIENLTNLTLEEDFYADQEKVSKTFARIKELEAHKDKLDEDWIEISLTLE